MRNILLLLLAGTFCSLVTAQHSSDKVRSKGFPVFPKITNTVIPGAPILSQPVQITGTEQEIRTEKHGLAYPTFYDWNHDGKTDLLLGEFETGKTGSNIKVYLNNGTNKKPRYSGKYFYATDTKGDTLTAHQWCCIGTHPRLVDFDNDGFMDILTGQYNPGLISLWRGSKNGFLPREYVEQEGYVEDATLAPFDSDDTNPKNNIYWNYTSAAFADFNGDGRIDLFVGGGEEFRVALNEGTNDHPKFGLRKHLLSIDGLPLSVIKPSQKAIEEARKAYKLPNYAGVGKGFVTPVDWDGDGVLDLLVTHAYYTSTAKDPVIFFRGVQTDKGLRFEDAKPLFTATDAKKTFPGCQPNITVTDYNHDGVPDLVIGVSLPTVNGFEIDSLVAWNYLRNLEIESPGKDAGRAIAWEGGLEGLKKKVESEPMFKRYYLGQLTDYKYLTLRHRGYVYVMLGKKNTLKAQATKGIIGKNEVKIENKNTKTSNAEGPVQYDVKSAGAVPYGGTSTIDVILKIKDGWYGYADNDVNKSLGLIPTTVKFDFPEGFDAVGETKTPNPSTKGAYKVYKGNEIRFTQQFKITGRKANGKLLSMDGYPVNVTIQYQTCNAELCLPPVTNTVQMIINVSSN